jgi:hypothetical protein
VIEEMMNTRRSIEATLVDLLALYERDPRPALARTIELIRAEIEYRQTCRSNFLQSEDI